MTIKIGAPFLVVNADGEVLNGAYETYDDAVRGATNEITDTVDDVCYVARFVARVQRCGVTVDTVE